ncbi:30S ribosomal protein S8 [Candidatus Sumerlaeota bacterium]|nr:30S ribosomal protein S8 [Candidatus Sumerlaeales bacterium]NLD61057.1 30S ribosomal protein S8 [Candidatus Sumerlaeota bacterium]
MNVTDTVADMLTRIRNANAANKDSVEIPYSHLNHEIAKVLREEGYIKDCFWTAKGRKKAPIRVFLKYGQNREKVIHDIQRVSRPGIRRYTDVDNVPKVLGGLGIAIISTSRGLMTDAQCRRTGIGGEVLCVVW